MTALQAIVKAIKIADLGYPYSPDVYEGKDIRYITYNYADDRGADFGDDVPGCNLCPMQIHLFMPKEENYQSDKARMRTALFSTGFTYPSITVMIDENTKQRHIIFECEFTEEGE